MPAKTQLFNIRIVDSSGEEKLTNRISTEAEIDEKATLGTVRNLLAKEKKLDSGKYVIYTLGAHVREVRH
jgi:hypothetical protein